MRYLFGFICVLALGVMGCGETAGTGPAMIQVLVTNDDGIAAPGIDALVEALRAEPMVELTVVAPDGNRSGSGDTTTEGPVNGVAATTESGFAGTAVDGFPADAVIYALEEVLSSPPDLVMSGINQGQNLACGIDDSGTVGAARTASRRGIPALALSQGFGTNPMDYPAGVEQALNWFRENRDAAAAGTLSASTVPNINIPSCAEGSVRGLLSVTPATEPSRFEAQDCLSTIETPANDLDAFANGFATISQVPLEGDSICP
jgi:5'-nucleotidase